MKQKQTIQYEEQLTKGEILRRKAKEKIRRAKNNFWQTLKNIELSTLPELYFD